jgi:hypothetical protein
MEITPDLIEKLRELPLEAQREVLDFIDAPSQRRRCALASLQQEQLNFPVDHWGNWPADFSLRRQDLYGPRGR